MMVWPVNDDTKIIAEISRKVLIIGPDYKDHRGGIGAVLSVYSKYFEVFKFICTHRSASILLRIFIFFISLLKLLLKLLTDRQVRIIHIHGASYGSFYRKFIVFIICKTFRKKIIYHIHGGEYDLFIGRSGIISNKMIRYMIENSDYLIALSMSWKIFFESNFTVKEITILPNIIEPPLRKVQARTTSKIKFLFLGRIGDGKGIYDLIEVIQKRKNYYLDHMELYVGGDGESEVLSDLVRKYGLSEIVTYKGWIKGKEKNSLLNDADIFILPSYNEGLPISILEAMSYNKPVISTKVGGIPEIVKNHVNGILINPGDHRELENAIDFFITKPWFIELYGNASMEIVKDYFPQAVIPRIEKIYNLLL